MKPIGATFLGAKIFTDHELMQPEICWYLLHLCATNVSIFVGKIRFHCEIYVLENNIYKCNLYELNSLRSYNSIAFPD